MEVALVQGPESLAVTGALLGSSGCSAGPQLPVPTPLVPLHCSTCSSCQSHRVAQRTLPGPYPTRPCPSTTTLSRPPTHPNPNPPGC